jgi:hypothetical protein
MNRREDVCPDYGQEKFVSTPLLICPFCKREERSPIDKDCTRLCDSCSVMVSKVRGTLVANMAEELAAYKGIPAEKVIQQFSQDY